MLHVDIRKTLGSFHLDACFDAQDGTMALLGASGCGKSVTLKCIAGILTPDEGQITLDGVPLVDSAARINLPPQRRQVGYLFQQYALFPNMTVRQNIAAAVRDKARRKDKSTELICRMALEGVADLRPAQLSGGQQQRCALARILASEPRAILLDEPFSALDSYLKQQLELELADTLSAFSGTVVWVSHDRGEVYRNCRRVCVMDRGRTQPSTDTAALFVHPATEAAARLSGCENFLDVLPERDGLTVPQWGVTLTCPGVPPAVRRAGIRARQVLPGTPGTVNALPCTVDRVVEDMASTVVLLRPEGALPGAPSLRMELSPQAWADLGAPSRLVVSVAPEDILLFQDL